MGGRPGVKIELIIPYFITDRLYSQWLNSVIYWLINH